MKLEFDFIDILVLPSAPSSIIFFEITSPELEMATRTGLLLNNLQRFRELTL